VAEAFIRQAILHGAIAAILVEALLTTWRIRSADARLRFWFVALAAPFVLLPIFFLTTPSRLDDHFAATRALFASARWNAVRVAGLPVDEAALVLLALAGTALLLRDLLPLIVSVWGAADTPRAAVPVTPFSEGAPTNQLTAAVRRQATDMGADPPAVEVLAHDRPVLFVRGTRSPTLVASSGLLDRLSGDEVAAALAHELAHVRFRDPLLGWLLMAARILMFWNPAVQLVARAVVQETEHRADAAAVHAAGADAYQQAFRLLMEADQGLRAQSGTRWDRLSARMHLHHVETRSAVLRRVNADAERRPVAAKLAACAGLLAVLLFFVV
jgi:Zn-dependent protease with chaperone function